MGLRSAAMSVLAGPLFAAALLLGAAGVRKVADPGPTRIALRTAGLPSAGWTARLIGLGEVTIAAATLAVGGPITAAAIAAAYLAFALFTRQVITKGGRRASCGCFGASDTPVSRWHVGVDLVIAGVAALAVAWPPDGIVAVARDTPAAGIPFLVSVVLLAALLQALLTALPDVWAAANPPRRSIRSTLR